jgi:D-threonate/D-erythronate kinase
MRSQRALLLVTADDSTGAMEAGAGCADAGLTVDVVPIGVAATTRPSESNCVVIDLRSRHASSGEARRRIIDTTTEDHRVHKIDSTLRGNWSAELATLVDAGRRVVLIPSHPRAGRICAEGVVYVNGVPVAESELGNDPRLPVRSSRPSESLPGTELAGPDALTAWLMALSSGVAILDATTLDDIDQLVAIALGADDTVLAGPASVVEAVARIYAPVGASIQLPDPLLPGPIVVVCASLHPVSRAQIAKVAETGVEVATSSEERGQASEDIAVEVAERAHQIVAWRHARSVILVGGDTAEAFIGDSVVRVFGSIDAGISLGDAEVRGTKLRLAGKPGGFGTANTLVDLVTR